MGHRTDGTTLSDTRGDVEGFDRTCEFGARGDGRTTDCPNAVPNPAFGTLATPPCKQTGLVGVLAKLPAALKQDANTEAHEQCQHPDQDASMRLERIRRPEGRAPTRRTPGAAQ